MRALVYEGPREMVMRDIPIPEPGENEVLIKIHKAGICGSELSGYLGKNALRKPPLVMGHEFAGTIEKLGAGVNEFNIGDRVTANPLVSCGKCLDCQNGAANLCAQRVLIGAGRPGAFAEYTTVPAVNVYRVSDSVSMDNAALAEPFACAARIARLADLTPIDHLLIIGAGPIGLLTLRAAQLHGVRKIVVMDLNQDRLSIVRAMGGTAASSVEELDQLKPGRGFDKAVDAVGLDATRQQCMHYARPGARVVFSGLHSADSQLPVNLAIRNELTLLGSFGYNPIDFHTALQWIEHEGANIDQWLMHAPLEQGKDCFEKLLSDPGPVVKIILEL